MSFTVPEAALLLFHVNRDTTADRGEGFFTEYMKVDARRVDDRATRRCDGGTPVSLLKDTEPDE